MICTICGTEVICTYSGLYCSRKCKREQYRRTAAAKPRAYDDALRAGCEAKLSAPQISEITGVSVAHLTERAWQLGLHFQSRSSEWRIKAAELHSAGHTDRQIAEQLSINVEAVTNWRNTTDRQCNRANSPIAWHAKMVELHAKGYDLQMIADIVRKTPRAVQKALSARGLRRNDPKQEPRKVPERAVKPVAKQPKARVEQEPIEHNDDWPESVPMPGLPPGLAVPSVLIVDGEIKGGVVHGGRIIRRCDDFIEAFRWLRLTPPPCIVARASDYVALQYSEQRSKKKAKPVRIFSE